MYEDRTVAGFGAGVGIALIFGLALSPPPSPAEELAGVAKEGMSAAQVERSFVEAVFDMREGRSSEALNRVERLLRIEPNFRLAHLLKAELIGSEELRRQVAPDDSILSELQAEQQARVRGVLYRPPVGTLPASILRVPPGAGTMAVVDLDRSRLYVIGTDGGKPEVVADFYAAAGRGGPDKRREGDGRTPVGVYRIMNRLRDAQLPPLYGAGALTLDYPNPWDRYKRRTGDGIWIHGTERELYSRPPRSSDGCVTLANSGYEAIAEDLGPQSRVIIENGVEWVDRAELERGADSFYARIEAWRRDWESRDTERYLTHYSTSFAAEGRDYRAWSEHKRRVNAQKTFIEIRLEQLAIYRYPGEPRLILVEFVQDYRSSNFNSRRSKQQYWRLEDDDRWRIVYEGGS